MIKYTNRRVFEIGSALAGVGVGFFIDEICKFYYQLK
jgi:hypothetical protein